MDDRHFEEELSRWFLEPAPTADRDRLVAPIMQRIEAEDSRRSMALGASAVIGAALAVSAIAASGAARPARIFITELSTMTTSFELPQLGLWGLVPLAAAAAVAISALALTRAAQAL